MLDFLSLSFVQHALIASVLAAIVCGVVGTLIVLNRLVFLAGGVAHAAYGGVGLALFFQLPMMPTLLGFTSATSLLMGWLTEKSRERTEVIIGALWAAGMATGILLLNFRGGYNVDLTSYLFGSILVVTTGDLSVMALIAAAILALVIWRYDDFLMISFDPEYARTRQVPVRLMYNLLLVLTALASVILIRVVGIILTIALLTIPPFLGMRYTKQLWKMMMIAGLSTLVFSIGGLFAAYWLNVTAGAAIIMLATLTLGVILFTDHFLSRRRLRQTVAGFARATRD